MEPKPELVASRGVMAATHLAATDDADDGFSAFYLTHEPALLRALTAVLGDVHLAGDALAEAMVKAHLRWRRLAQSPNPAGWVYRVAVNWAKRRRQRGWREVTTDRMPDTRAVMDQTSDPGLVAALAALPFDQRSVVVLRHVLDWSEAQTAAALDVPAGTVKSRLSRGLAALAAELGGSDDR